ncbi:isochorismatase family protein [Vreelandella nanhaiensis]|uniref:Isochorismatase family protein n=1 Tax=Vreelandella nanhaiensis TaxID=1258546 RepID=A0A3S0Z1J9_9GAMM|nr:isochorismatase family protein [Halomonas nanhaiensis]RUR34688.1 isochorismatase family protein [Halomonas nanhaiensis]
MRLYREKSLLLIVDLQTGLLPVIDGEQQVITEAGWLAQVAERLDVPVWITEQLPEKLGKTAPTLLQPLTEYRCWQKQHFSAMEDTVFSQALSASTKQQIVICGAEAHICVLQSALGLLEAGYQVYWLSEATASRRREEATLARERACQQGAISVSADMVAYEWLRQCDTALFKEAHQQFLKPRSARTLTFF